MNRTEKAALLEQMVDDLFWKTRFVEDGETKKKLTLDCQRTWQKRIEQQPQSSSPSSLSPSSLVSQDQFARLFQQARGRAAEAIQNPQPYLDQSRLHHPQQQQHVSPPVDIDARLAANNNNDNDNNDNDNDEPRLLMLDDIDKTTVRSMIADLDAAIRRVPSLDLFHDVAQQRRHEWQHGHLLSSTRPDQWEALWQRAQSIVAELYGVVDPPRKRQRESTSAVNGSDTHDNSANKVPRRGSTDGSSVAGGGEDIQKTSNNKNNNQKDDDDTDKALSSFSIPRLRPPPRRQRQCQIGESKQADPSSHDVERLYRDMTTELSRDMRSRRHVPLQALLIQKRNEWFQRVQEDGLLLLKDDDDDNDDSDDPRGRSSVRDRFNRLFRRVKKRAEREWEQLQVAEPSIDWSFLEMGDNFDPEKMNEWLCGSKDGKFIATADICSEDLDL